MFTYEALVAKVQDLEHELVAIGHGGATIESVLTKYGMMYQVQVPICIDVVHLLIGGFHEQDDLVREIFVVSLCYMGFDA